MKKKDEEKNNLYRPIRQSATKYRTEPTMAHHIKVEPGTSDGQHHEYGKTCKQRWAVQVEGKIQHHRHRRTALRASRGVIDVETHRQVIPKLVTV